MILLFQTDFYERIQIPVFLFLVFKTWRKIHHPSKVSWHRHQHRRRRCCQRRHFQAKLSIQRRSRFTFLSVFSTFDVRSAHRSTWRRRRCSSKPLDQNSTSWLETLFCVFRTEFFSRASVPGDCSPTFPTRFPPPHFPSPSQLLDSFPRRRTLETTLTSTTTSTMKLQMRPWESRSRVDQDILLSHFLSLSHSHSLSFFLSLTLSLSLLLASVILF